LLKPKDTLTFGKQPLVIVISTSKTYFTAESRYVWPLGLICKSLNIVTLTLIAAT